MTLLYYASLTLPRSSPFHPLASHHFHTKAIWKKKHPFTNHSDWDWLVVLAILKNTSSPIGKDYPQYIMENKSHVPNHQPDRQWLRSSGLARILEHLKWSFPQVNSATDSESQRLWLGRENGEPQSGWLMIFPLKQPHFRGPNLIKIYYNHETSHHYLLKYLHIFGHKLEIHPNFHNTSTSIVQVRSDSDSSWHSESVAPMDGFPGMANWMLIQNAMGFFSCVIFH